MMVNVDPTRIGVWGGSYGGLMTALALARYPDLFAAGVDYAGGLVPFNLNDRGLILVLETAESGGEDDESERPVTPTSRGLLRDDCSDLG